MISYLVLKVGVPFFYVILAFTNEIKVITTLTPTARLPHDHRRVLHLHHIVHPDDLR
jgi:hypothetical protein